MGRGGAVAICLLIAACGGATSGDATGDGSSGEGGASSGGTSTQGGTSSGMPARDAYIGASASNGTLAGGAGAGGGGTCPIDGGTDCGSAAEVTCGGVACGDMCRDGATYAFSESLVLILHGFTAYCDSENHCACGCFRRCKSTSYPNEYCVDLCVD